MTEQELKHEFKETRQTIGCGILMVYFVLGILSLIHIAHTDEALTKLKAELKAEWRKP